MKKDIKFVVATTLIAMLAAGVPLGLKWTNEQKASALQKEIEALPFRQPAKATRELRQALVSCTEVRIHLDVPDAAPPELNRTAPGVAAVLGKPAIVLRGQEAQKFIASLHVERAGSSAWRPSLGPHPGAAEDITALEFYSGNKWIADIRVFYTMLRWYTPLQYKGDAPLLPESVRYLEQATSNHKR